MSIYFFHLHIKIGALPLCRGSSSVEEVLARAAEVFSGYPCDLPFVLFYELDSEGRAVRLRSSTGIETGAAASPARIVFEAMDNTIWPLEHVVRTGRSVLVEELEKLFGPMAVQPYPESLRQALVLPVVSPGRDKPAAIMIAGVSPRIQLDEAYRGFFELLITTVGSSLANAMYIINMRQEIEERKRVEQSLHERTESLEQELNVRRSLLYAIADEVWHCDANDHITLLNRAVHRAFGFKTPSLRASSR